MDENEPVVVDAEVVDEPAEPADEPADAPAEDKKVEKPTETLEQREARLARQLEQTRKKMGKTDDEPAPKAKSSTLDDTALDYLDLKGVSEQEDIEVIQSVIAKTGLSVREALKDDYVSSKLAANKAAREVKSATPSSTKRSGGASPDSVSAAVAKFESTGKMPDDFELQSAVVDALAKRSGSATPAWHRK